jgi:hypothetical protein
MWLLLGEYLLVLEEHGDKGLTENCSLRSQRTESGAARASEKQGGKIRKEGATEDQAPNLCINFPQIFG